MHFLFSETAKPSVLATFTKIHDVCRFFKYFQGFFRKTINFVNLDKKAHFAGLFVVQIHSGKTDLRCTFPRAPLHLWKIAASKDPECKRCPVFRFLYQKNKQARYNKICFSWKNSRKKAPFMIWCYSSDCQKRYGILTLTDKGIHASKRGNFYVPALSSTA